MTRNSQARETTIRIIHFDDEVNTVSMIPNSLYNYFVTRCASWVNERECRYDRYVRSFLLTAGGPGGHPFRIEYDLTDDVQKCQEKIAGFDRDRDIAIFDLMRQTDGGMAPIGEDLYKRARGRGVAENRIFILSGFPEIFEKALPEVTIPPEQRFMKPTPAIEVVGRLVKLFPEPLRV